LVRPIGFQSPQKEENEMSKTAPNKSKARKAKSANQEGKLSCIDAAAKLLAETNEPMTTKAMIQAMAAKGYWSSPNGKTPAGTLYSAILREIKVRGTEARFRRSDRGLFVVNS
jgi:hypothetical protein